MLSFGMREGLSERNYRAVFDKLAWLSGVLGEVDEWLDSRRLTVPNAVEAHEQSVITIENLDATIARESG